MQKFAVAAALMLAATVADAGDVYKSTDAQGRPIYTDKPPSLPAERLDVKSATTDTVAVRQRYEEQMQRNAAQQSAQAEATAAMASQRTAAQLAEEDRAKRCQDARARYDKLYNSWRLYEAGPTEGERRYLTAEEIDAARANATQTIEEFCGNR